MPGHSPGSVIFYFAEQEAMISGDVLFAGSIGRVDLPGVRPRSDARSLERLTLPRRHPHLLRARAGDDPGHEKQRNPFLTQDW